MCCDRPVDNGAVKALVNANLSAALADLFASHQWQILRAAQPGQCDLSILRELVSAEALRLSVCLYDAILFDESEFIRNGRR